MAERTPDLIALLDGFAEAAPGASRLELSRSGGYPIVRLVASSEIAGKQWRWSRAVSLDSLFDTLVPEFAVGRVYGEECKHAFDATASQGAAPAPPSPETPRT